MTEQEQKDMDNVENKLAYVNQIQDQIHKVRTQLSLGFDGNGETHILMMMLVKPIRETIVPEIERIKLEYAKNLNEEAGNILIKFGEKIVQDGKPPLSITDMFKKVAEENKLSKLGLLKPEKLTPNMYKWNSVAKREYESAKLTADNIVNSYLLQIILDRLFECGLLFDMEGNTNI